jgi:hypothetical protein
MTHNTSVETTPIISGKALPYLMIEEVNAPTEDAVLNAYI